MKMHPNQIVLLICCLMITCSAASLTLAQNDTNAPDAAVEETEDERLARMLADRNEQLMLKLENLRRTEESMGENHPSLLKVRTQIQELEKEIETWSSPSETLMDMSDRELRAIVLQLSIRVDRLENRMGAAHQLNRNRNRNRRLPPGAQQL